MQQLRLVTARGCVAAVVLGILFTFITLRLTLGSAGMTPPLTVPGGLLSYALLQTYTRLVPHAKPFTAQENAAVQTMATSCYKIVGFAGYSSYLTALSYAVYLQLGGVPAGQPGYDADSVIEPELHRVYPYLVCIAFGGIFVLLGLRVLLIVRWRLPFPSGTASGSMINSLHDAHRAAPRGAAAAAAADGDAEELQTALDAQQPHATGATYLDLLPDSVGVGGTSPVQDSYAGDESDSRGSDPGGGQSPEQLAARKVKVLAYTALGSFLFDVFKWLFQGSAPGCGFANWPTFGLAAAQWTWRFDFQQQYIGSGFLVPHIVAWSMLLGAILSWGMMWPLLSAREGDWFPAGLSFGDMRGLAGYKIFLSVALLLGEGAFILAKAALLGYQHLHSRRHQRSSQSSSRGLLPSRHSTPTGRGTSDSSGRSTEWCLAPAQPDKLGQQVTTDVSTCTSSSTSCSLHRSVDAAAASSDTLRCRSTTSAEFNRQQQQHVPQQQVVHPQHSNHEQRQVEAGCTEVPAAAADAVAVVPDDDPSTSGQDAHTKDVTRLPLATGPCSGGINNGSLRRRGPSQPAAGGADTDCAEGGGVAGATFQETHAERRSREAVFLSDSIPGWLGPAGYCLAAGIGVAFIPLIYTPARWYMVLTAFLLGPLVALVNGFGVGLTDVDNSANYSTVAMFLFAAWASSSSGSSGHGIVAGCVLSGVLMVFSVSAAVLLQDLRTGYITLTPPSPLLLAQVLGAAFGVLFSPLAFALFWSTGQVGLSDGPYPAPFAVVTRGIASIGVLGFGALPRYCVAMSGAFFVAAVAICVVREVLPVRYARFVPSPMGMAFPFFIPASTALDFWLGSVIVMLWEWKAPQSAAHYAPLAGAGLLVGDGLWSIPAAILALANVSPPMCMKFE